MKRLILILIASLSLTACNQSGDGSADQGINGGIFMVPFDTCTDIPYAQIAVAFSTAQNAMLVYEDIVDCQNDITYSAPTYAWLNSGDSAISSPNGGSFYYDSVHNTATAAGLLISPY